MEAKKSGQRTCNRFIHRLSLSLFLSSALSPFIWCFFPLLFSLTLNCFSRKSIAFMCSQIASQQLLFHSLSSLTVSFLLFLLLVDLVYESIHDTKISKVINANVQPIVILKSKYTSPQSVECCVKRDGCFEFDRRRQRR